MKWKNNGRKGTGGTTIISHWSINRGLLITELQRHRNHDLGCRLHIHGPTPQCLPPPDSAAGELQLLAFYYSWLGDASGDECDEQRKGKTCTAKNQEHRANLRVSGSRIHEKTKRNSRMDIWLNIIVRCQMDAPDDLMKRYSAAPVCCAGFWRNW
jgi:hypothetical protein